MYSPARLLLLFLNQIREAGFQGVDKPGDMLRRVPQLQSSTR
jgi:hypothetical protein